MFGHDCLTISGNRQFRADQSGEGKNPGATFTKWTDFAEIFWAGGQIAVLRWLHFNVKICSLVQIIIISCILFGHGSNAYHHSNFAAGCNKVRLVMVIDPLASILWLISNLLQWLSAGSVTQLLHEVYLANFCDFSQRLPVQFQLMNTVTCRNRRLGRLQCNFETASFVQMQYRIHRSSARLPEVCTWMPEWKH